MTEMTEIAYGGPHRQEVEFHKALIKAKAQFGPLRKSKVNPHFKSAYADLVDIATAVDGPLAANGFTVSHEGRVDTAGAYFRTTLHHVGGHTTWTAVAMPAFENAQKWGSWQTYAKRYGKAGLLDLVADEDDDGNAASTAGTEPPAGRSAPSYSADGESPPDQPGRNRTKAILGVLNDELGDGKPWEGRKADVLIAVFGTSSIHDLWATPVADLNADIKAKWPAAMAAAKIPLPGTDDDRVPF